MSIGAKLDKIREVGAAELTKIDAITWVLFSISAESD